MDIVPLHSQAHITAPSLVPSAESLWCCNEFQFQFQFVGCCLSFVVRVNVVAGSLCISCIGCCTSRCMVGGGDPLVVRCRPAAMVGFL